MKLKITAEHAVLKHEKLLFGLFLILGIFLRFYRLGAVPPGLYFDEVLYGLDSLSILKTGKDIYGHFLPLAFQSSGYYPPVFPYLLAPFLLFLPLSAFTVRFPIATLGILSSVFFYFFLKNLINDKRNLVPLITFIILTTLPWYVHFTRVAFLSSLGLSLMIIGLYFIVQSFKKNYFIIFSSIFFVLASFSHYGYRLLASALFFIFMFIYRSNLRRNTQVFLLLTSVWILAIFLQLIAHVKFNSDFWVNRLASRDLLTIGKEYLVTFSPSFLFTNGEDYLINNPWSRGQLPIALLPFLIFGLLNLFKFDRKFVYFIIAFLFIAPIPSAVAGQGAHAVRNAPLMVPLIISISIGIESFLRIANKSKVMLSIFYLLSLVFIVEILINYKFYFTDYPATYSTLWGESIRKSINFADKNRNLFKNVAFTDTYNKSLSYFAFQSKADPALVQRAILFPVKFSGLPAKKLGNYYFLTTEELEEKNILMKIDPGTLLIDPIYFIENTNSKTAKCTDELSSFRSCIIR